MRLVSFDVETTTFQKGSPFSRRNSLVLGGYYCSDVVSFFTPENISSFQQYLTSDTLLITFNGKFDLHWGRRYNLDFSNVKLWDCQLAEFLLSNQKNIFPSLDSCLQKYNLPLKIDVVKTEYWDKGIDTDSVPLPVLKEYLEGDLIKTFQVYQHQLKEFNDRPDLLKLFRLQCADELVLEEMEFNGLLYNVDECVKKEKELTIEIQQIEQALKVGYENIPINWDSSDHLSCFLYGGTIIDEQRIPIGTYKTGLKAGQVRNKVVRYEFKLPQLVKPSKGSELQKEGYYSTNEPTLRCLKANKSTRNRIDLLLRRAKLEKLRGTYFAGIPQLSKEMDWPTGKIFGQYNQCVARTGRIASSKPNQQNFPEEWKRMIISRYD